MKVFLVALFLSPTGTPVLEDGFYPSTHESIETCVSTGNRVSSYLEQLGLEPQKQFFLACVESDSETEAVLRARSHWSLIRRSQQ